MSLLDTNDSFIHMWYIWRFVGIHPYKTHRWLYIIYGIVINLAASVVSPMLVFSNVFFINEFGLILRTLQSSITLIISSLKQFVIFTKISDLQKVKLYLNELDQRASRNDEEVAYLKNVIKQCRLIALTIEIVFFFSLLSYAIPGFLQRKLVFEGWFPFDWTSSGRNYMLAFGFQLFSTLFQIIQNAGNDAYPPIYINVLNGQIRVLCMRIARIGKDPRTTPEENYIELVSCVNDHKKVISLFEAIRPVISQTVLIQFIVTAFVLCLTAINFIIFNREFSQLINSIVYITAIFMESYPVCYFGNTLTWETNRLTTAIYSCNWQDQSVKFRKSIIIFMQRSQKSNIILAGGLVSITLQTFTSIIRFSFSIFTMLSQMR